MSDRDNPSKSQGFSRRGFLKGLGAGTVATGLLPGVNPAAAQSHPALRGPGEMPVTLHVNGQRRQLNLEPRVTLLDALRNRLDLTGSKKVCDRGTCGACTVLLDDKPVYACTLLAIEADGRKITTIEGLGVPRNLSPLQAAFVKHDGQQCGFCTPGFIVAGTAFLKRNPNPTRQQVCSGLGGNLCRCGTYAGITEAFLEAARTTKGGI
jgi:xanthine dehydrogenase YagT iron-sulfur-binding subunit